MFWNETERKALNMIADLFGWPAGAYWFTAENEALDGSSPYELFMQGRAEEVLTLLQRLADPVTH